ncbi:hypothetical protein QTP70_025768 [Hemibagrus guttatus]|uniref:ribonuclease H n=1 Tax=Hemibagrus guttatus TaxID=175788 RepID=A0AAE0R938_9TELE|nr:hypothetical protein QTP70_025768 [Hemibagrus guttatus]
MMCTMDEHKGHDTVSAAAGRAEKQRQLLETQEKSKQRIQDREKELQKLRKAVETHKHSAQSAVQETERIFTDLIKAIERKCSEVTELIRVQEEASVSQAQKLMNQLEQEIAELKRRDAEIEKLSLTEDPVYFLQSFQSVLADPISADLPLISSYLTFEDVVKSVSHLRDKVEECSTAAFGTILDGVRYVCMFPPPEPQSREDFLKYSCQLRLDPNTANKLLCLTDEDMVVTCSTSSQSYPVHAERFDHHLQIQLLEVQGKFQKKIQEREQKLQELTKAVESHKHFAQTAVQETERLFYDLIISIKKSCSEVTALIRTQEKATVSLAEELMKQLEQEIAELKRKDAEMEELSHAEDPIHFLQVGCELEEKERFWSELDEVMESIPTGERVVIGADFNGHVGEGNTGDEEVMGKFGVKKRNLEGQTVVDFAQRMDMAVVNTYFQKRKEHRVTYKSGDLEKAYDRVPREELWYCMRKSGVAEKYVRVVQDMYERSRTVVRCAVGQKEKFKVEVGLHQGSALSPFLFAIVMDQLSEEVRQESPWTMMFADDIVMCSESREQVEENLERWRFALERRGMKVSRSKTEYMCVNEREGSGTVRLQGEEVKKVQEFKYLGSTVQSNGECGKEVKKRVQAGSVHTTTVMGKFHLEINVPESGEREESQRIQAA